MSTDIRTRRLIVTLPATTGEEADSVATFIDEALTDGFTVTGTATHALDEAPLPHPLDHIRASAYSGRVRININAHYDSEQARKAAALLLRAADEAEGIV